MTRVYDEIQSEVTPSDDDEVEDFDVACPICDREGDAELLHARRVAIGVVREWECGCGASWSTIEQVSHHDKVKAPPAVIDATLRVRARRQRLPYGVYSCRLSEHVILRYSRSNQREKNGYWDALIVAAPGQGSYKQKVSIGPADDIGSDAPSLFSFEKAAASPKITQAVTLMLGRLREREAVRQAMARTGKMGLAAPPDDNPET